jgi:cell division GTPase FtsZ
MLKVGIIGLGNAGNQIAELAKRTRNIPGIAINSSEKDLSNICNVDTVIVGDEKGAGKDRTEAKIFIRDNIKDLLSQKNFTTLIDDNEVLFIISSIGGGTGSGMSPVLTNILTKMYPTKKFIIVQIYPPISESVAAQQNGIDYLKEVREFMPDAVYMSYDNGKRSDKPTDVMMREVNNEIVEDICVIRGDYQFATPYSSIDEKDMTRLIETSGRLVIVKADGLKEKDLDNKSIQDILISNLLSSTTTEIERDMLIKRMGVITNLNEKLHKGFDTKMNVLKELVGEPIEGFEHIHINSEPDENNRVVVILAGLSIPDDRIEKIVQRIESVKDALKKTKVSSILDTVETSEIKTLRVTSKTTTSEIDLPSIFDKFMG